MGVWVLALIQLIFGPPLVGKVLAATSSPNTFCNTHSCLGFLSSLCINAMCTFQSCFANTYICIVYLYASLQHTKRSTACLTAIPIRRRRTHSRNPYAVFTQPSMTHASYFTEHSSHADLYKHRPASKVNDLLRLTSSNCLRMRRAPVSPVWRGIQVGLQVPHNKAP